MEKVLFITNKIYIDSSRREGGVRNCTFEYIHLLQQKFEVVIFPVEVRRDFFYKLRAKAGLRVYNDFNTTEYLKSIEKIISEQNIRFIFLNLSHTIPFSKSIKQHLRNQLKIILCSHGNETGDYLQGIIRNKYTATGIKSMFSNWVLGKMIMTEASLRIHAIDMVLTVSQVEEQMEKWLGTKNVMMIPRVVQKMFINHQPVLNRVGFVGDLSHFPNRFGITEICKELSKQEHPVNFRLVGSPESAGKELEKQFSFVTYLGYLNEKELEEEAATWAFFLNLVFYYSGGVSTKLGKALGWGLPVISTEQGNRGYIFNNGNMLIAKNPADMEKLISENAGSFEKISSAQSETKVLVESTPTLNEIMNQLFPRLLEL